MLRKFCSKIKLYLKCFSKSSRPATMTQVITIDRNEPIPCNTTIPVIIKIALVTARPDHTIMVSGNSIDYSRNPNIYKL